MLATQERRAFIPKQDRALFNYHIALMAGNPASIRVTHETLVEYLGNGKADAPDWDLYPAARDTFTQVDDPSAAKKLRYISLSVSDQIAERFLTIASQQFEAPKAQNARRMSEYTRFAWLVKETENLIALERKK